MRQINRGREVHVSRKQQVTKSRKGWEKMENKELWRVVTRGGKKNRTRKRKRRNCIICGGCQYCVKVEWPGCSVDVWYNYLTRCWPFAGSQCHLVSAFHPQTAYSKRSFLAYGGPSGEWPSGHTVPLFPSAENKNNVTNRFSRAGLWFAAERNFQH